MDLKGFVEESIVAILGGVNEAQFKLKELGIGAAVNPKFSDNSSIGETDIQTMEFDVAVSVSEKTEGDGGASLKVVGVFDAGGKISRGIETGSISRIKFSLKILPPFTTVPRTLNAVHVRPSK